MFKNEKNRFVLPPHFNILLVILSWGIKFDVSIQLDSYFMQLKPMLINFDNRREPARCTWYLHSPDGSMVTSHVNNFSVIIKSVSFESWNELRLFAMETTEILITSGDQTTNLGFVEKCKSKQQSHIYYSFIKKTSPLQFFIEIISIGPFLIIVDTIIISGTSL